MSAAGSTVENKGSRTEVDLRLRLLLVLAFVAILSWVIRDWQLDDSLIYARYFRHSLEGRGLTFNDGEHINALTSVLYSWLVLAMSHLLRGRVLLSEALLSGVFLFLAAAVSECVVPLSGLTVAAGAYLYLCKGMETSLFLLVLLLTVLAYTARRLNWLPLLCVLCVLTRFEGGLMLAIVGWRCWQEDLRPKTRAYLAPALLLLGYLAFNMHFYHRLVPQSASAKLGQGMSGFWGKWPTAFLNVPEMVVQPIGGSLVALLLLAAIAWASRKHVRLARWNQVVHPFLLLLAAFYILGNIPNYHWYYAPFVFFLTIAAVNVIPQTWPVLAVSAIMLLFTLRESMLQLHHRNHEVQDYDTAALWLENHTSPTASVAAVETGHIGWFADRYLIDIVGLTTPRNATYTAHKNFSGWFEARPDYIVVHSKVHFPWEEVAIASPEYEMLPLAFGDVRLLHRRQNDTTHPKMDSQAPAPPNATHIP